MKKVSVFDMMERIVRWILVGFMFVSVGSTFGQVIFRYVFNNPLIWTEEAARYSLIWMTMLGAAVATRMLAHIAIDTLLNRFQGKVRQRIGLVLDVMVLGFCALLLWFSLKLTVVSGQAVSTGLKISMAWVYAAMPTGFFLMIIFLLERIVLTIKGKYKFICMERSTIELIQKENL